MIGIFRAFWESGHCTEVRFASFQSGGFITVIVVNPPESKLEKRTYVQRSVHPSAPVLLTKDSPRNLISYDSQPPYLKF